MLFKKMNR